MSEVETRVVLQPVGRLVLVPVQGPVNEALLRDLRIRILDYLGRHGGRGVVLDMEGVEVLDEHDFEALRGVAEAASLMGAPVLFAGIRPGVAAGLTMLDVDDGWVCAVRTVEQAMARLS